MIPALGVCNIYENVKCPGPHRRHIFSYHIKHGQKHKKQLFFSNKSCVFLLYYNMCATVVLTFNVVEETGGREIDPT